MRSIGNLAREAGFSFKALSVTYLGFWDPVAEKQIVTLCRAKSTRLGLCESSVIASRASFNEVYIANRILNRDLHLEDDVISNDVNEVINM